jgi:hypothetical protein
MRLRNAIHRERERERERESSNDNVFDHITNEKASKRKKLLITSGTVALVVIGVALFAILLPGLFTKEQPKEQETVSDTTTAAITERIDDIKTETNAELSPESADTYIEELNRLLSKSTDNNQIFELKRLQMKSYFNTDRVETAVEIGEKTLNENELSEEQKLDIYIFMANTYIHKLKNPEQLEKWVELLQESVNLLDVPSWEVEMTYYRIRLSEQKEGVYYED